MAKQSNRPELGELRLEPLIFAVQAILRTGYKVSIGFVEMWTRAYLEPPKRVELSKAQLAKIDVTQPHVDETLDAISGLISGDALCQVPFALLSHVVVAGAPVQLVEATKTVALESLANYPTSARLLAANSTRTSTGIEGLAQIYEALLRESKVLGQGIRVQEQIARNVFNTLALAAVISGDLEARDVAELLAKRVWPMPRSMPESEAAIQLLNVGSNGPDFVALFVGSLTRTLHSELATLESNLESAGNRIETLANELHSKGQQIEALVARESHLEAELEDLRAELSNERVQRAIERADLTNKLMTLQEKSRRSIAINIGALTTALDALGDGALVSARGYVTRVRGDLESELEGINDVE